MMVLSGSRVVAATAAVIALAAIGAVTYLCSAGKLAGTDVLTVVLVILAGVGFTGAAHVTANAVKGSAGSGGG